MMKIPSRLEVERIREQYPFGSRIELISMDDPYTHLKSGDLGTVMGVDDMGQIMMEWDRGSSLSLIPEVDRFRKVEKNNKGGRR